MFSVPGDVWCFVCAGDVAGHTGSCLGKMVVNFFMAIFLLIFFIVWLLSIVFVLFTILQVFVVSAHRCITVAHVGCARNRRCSHYTWCCHTRRC